MDRNSFECTVKRTSKHTFGRPFVLAGLMLVLPACRDTIDPTILEFAASIQQGAPGDSATFTWSVRDSHSGTLACTFDAEGDGTAEASFEDCAAETSYTHTYTQAGAFNATLTVTDKAGNSAERSLSVLIATPLELGPGLHLLGPEDMVGGSVVLSFGNLGSGESVAIIPVNADKSVATEAMPYTLTASGFGSPAMARPAEPSAAGVASPELSARLRAHSSRAHSSRSLAKSPTSSPIQKRFAGQGSSRHHALHDRHVEILAESQALARDLRAKQARPNADRSPAAGSFDNCLAPYSVGKECTFYLSNENNDEITTELRYETANAYWFVDKNDLGDLSSADFEALGQDFEDTIVPADTEYFGPFSDVDNNDKIFIVFSNLLWDMGVLGYVYSIDLYTDEEIFPAYGIHSNEGDIFYATSPGPVVDEGYATKKEYIDTVLPATMVHELKHLIAAGVRFANDTEQEELWIEEGSAQAAQELIGLGDSQYYAEPMFRDPQNFNLVYSDRPAGVAGSAIYGYSFTFVWRVAEQLGHENFWLDWTAGPDVGIKNLEAHTGKSFDTLVQDWGLTLMFDHTSILSGYDYESLSLRQGWPTLGYSPLANATGNTRSFAYYLGTGQGGAASVAFTSSAAKPHLMVVRFDGSLSYKASERSGGDISGALKGPSGANLINTYMLACPEDEYCSYINLVTDSGANPAYTVPALPASKYEIYAWKDVDGDGDVTAGDFLGYHTEDGGETTALVVAPKSGLDIDVYELTE